MLAAFGQGDLLWSMLVFFFWFMAIWIFITVFADIFRRHDIGGGAKAGWILLIFIVPFFGALIYIAMRPSVAVGGGGVLRRGERRRGYPRRSTHELSPNDVDECREKDRGSSCGRGRRSEPA